MGDYSLAGLLSGIFAGLSKRVSYVNSLGKSGLADFLARIREKINASDSRQTIAIRPKLIGYSSLLCMTDILRHLFPSRSSIASTRLLAS